jgi:tetratricopeptide (TPR) repeat protein
VFFPRQRFGWGDGVLLTVGLAAAMLGSFGGAATAHQGEVPAGCPQVASLRVTPITQSPRTASQMAADALVAQGQAATRSFSGESVAKAIWLFEQAVRTDPEHGPAYIALARVHAQSQRYLSVPKTLARARAWDNLSAGRRLAPANIDGLHVLADQVIANTGDYQCARTILEAALHLDPHNARSNHYLSQLLSGMGEFDLAFQYADKALKAADADADARAFIQTNAGRPRYMAGDYDWVLTRYLESTPNAPLAHFYRSLAFGAKGMFQQALDEAKKYQAGDRGRDAGGLGMIALAHANAGQSAQARELLNELLQRDARGEHVVEYRIAAVYEALGERDEAFRWLYKDTEDRDGLGSWLLWLNHDPVWKALRKDPRFKDVQKRAGW